MTKTNPDKTKPRGNPGRKLERARRELKLTRQDVASRLKVPVSTIKYFDTWDLDKLDDARNIKQLIREYSLIVGLNPADFEPLIPYSPPPKKGLKPMVVLSRLSLSTLAVLIGLSVVGFLAWRTFVAAAKPLLILEQPSASQTTNQPTIEVSGSTSQQAQVYIDGFNVPVDADGKFNAPVILKQGANTVTITAINSFGRQAEVKRIVNYTP